MSTKVTVVMKDGQVMAARGGRKKAAKSGGKVLAVLRRGQFKLLWVKPASRWWPLPALRVAQLTSKYEFDMRELCIADVLGPTTR